MPPWLAAKGGGPSILHAPSLHSDEIVIFDVCSGPMMALCLAREDAVEGWRELLGPKEVTVAAEQAPERYKLPDAPTMIRNKIGIIINILIIIIIFVIIIIIIIFVVDVAVDISLDC